MYSSKLKYTGWENTQVQQNKVQNAKTHTKAADSTKYGMEKRTTTAESKYKMGKHRGTAERSTE